MRLSACLVAAAAAVAPALASLRGANSWDSVLANWNETQLLQVADYMAQHLLPFGYDHVVTDEGWYWTGDNEGDASLDAFGRPTPRLDQYPSAADGHGFRAIADALHAQGLKLGVWSIRGIPKLAAERRMPIFNSSFTADEAVTSAANCSWNNHCFGCAPSDDGSSCNDAAWAYYRSVASWYAQMRVDLVKIDCMFDQAYTGTFDRDLVAFTTAFKEVGIAVSLSPGPISFANGSFIAQTGLAVQYRVTQDFWDQWGDHGPTSYPTGLRSKLDAALQFAPLFGANGTSPDLDMLPLGYIQSHATQQPHGPVPSALTPDEQATVMSLWAITGAPLMFGGRLPLDAADPVDAATLALLTNAAILGVHNGSVSRTPVAPMGGGDPEAAAPPPPRGGPVAANVNQTYAWAALPAARADGSAAYVALFNGDEAAHTVQVRLADAGLAPGQLYCAFDLWTGARVPGTVAGSFAAPLRPHQAGVFGLYSSAAAPC